MLTPFRYQRQRSSRVASGSGESQIARTTTSSAHLLNVTVMSIEVFAMSRGKLLPDPLHDQVNAVLYCINAQEGRYEAHEVEGVIIQELERAPVSNFRDVQGRKVCVEYVADERALFLRLESLVHLWDPDFLTGFEVQKGSLGYLVDRASHVGVRVALDLFWLILSNPAHC